MIFFKILHILISMKVPSPLRYKWTLPMNLPPKIKIWRAQFWQILHLWPKHFICLQCSWSSYFNFFFWDYTVQLRHSQRTHTHTPMNTHTQTLSLWASSKTEPANPRDWRSHHWCLVVDGNVAYHWMHNAVKSQNIRSQGESNPEHQVLPEFL